MVGANGHHLPHVRAVVCAFVAWCVALCPPLPSAGSAAALGNVITSTSSCLWHPAPVWPCACVVAAAVTVVVVVGVVCAATPAAQLSLRTSACHRVGV